MGFDIGSLAETASSKIGGMVSSMNPFSGITLSGLGQGLLDKILPQANPASWQNPLRVAFPTGYMQSNLYRVFIFPPQSIQNEMSDKIQYLCKDAVFPFYSVETEEMYVNNVQKQFVKDFTFEDISFTFIVDAENKFIHFLLSWMELIRNKTTNMIGFRDDYIGNILIIVYNQYDIYRFSASAVNVFPVNVENITMTYGDNTEVMSITATFAVEKITYDDDASQTENSDYAQHRSNRQKVYTQNQIDKLLNNITGFIGKARKMVGGVIGQKNLYKLEKKYKVNTVLDKGVSASTQLAQKAQSGMAVVGNATSKIL